MDRCEHAACTAIIGSCAIEPDEATRPIAVVAECDVAEGIPAIAASCAGVRALVHVF
jgi:hypothetical protein